MRNKGTEEAKEAIVKGINFGSQVDLFQSISLPFSFLLSHFYISKSLMTMRG